MRWLRAAAVAAGLVAVLGVANREVLHKQAIVDHGRTVYLPLRSEDPRSLIRDGEMLLLYAYDAFPKPWDAARMPDGGTVILSLDENGVGRFARPDDGSPLRGDEVRIRYRRSFETGELRYGAATLALDDGRADHSARARYGVLKLDEEGTSVLIGVARSDRTPIEPP